MDPGTHPPSSPGLASPTDAPGAGGAIAGGPVGAEVQRLIGTLLSAPGDRPTLLRLAAGFSALGEHHHAARVLDHAERLFPGDEEVARACAALRSGGTDTGEGRSPPAAQRSGVPQGARSSGALLLPRTGSGGRRGSAPFGAVLLGAAACAPALGAYIVVGLRTHFTMGLLAAAGVLLVVAGAGPRLFPDPRSAARGVLRGIGIGLGLILLAAAASLIIALTRASG